MEDALAKALDYADRSFRVSHVAQPSYQPSKSNNNLLRTLVDEISEEPRGIAIPQPVQYEAPAPAQSPLIDQDC